MKIVGSGARHRIKRLVRMGLVCAVGLFPFSIPEPAGAETRASWQQEPLIIRNDRGGLLKKRLRELNQLRRTGRPVRIEGGICYSTCTMFLGLPQTCVSPRTTFGFHGPSSYGRPLDPEVFTQASKIIARHYPPALQDWYMETGRHKLRSLYRIDAQQIIAMGIKSC